jgi:hypothetical protein
MQTSLRLSTFFVVACGVLLLPRDARAFEAFVTDPLLPNYAYALATNGQQRACITCHNNPDGGTGCPGGGPVSCLNPFGMAVKAILPADVWSPSLAGADADGDGFTNGQELQDALGTWQRYTTGPGNPAYATRPGFSDDSPGLHDADGDRYCWYGRDLDMNGTCTGGGEASGGFDCNDAAASIHSGATELCTNFVDDDCNGLPTLSDPVCASVVDGDDDGYCPMGRDLNNNRSCLDGGENTADVDCDDTFNTVFPGAPENCSDNRDNDCDGDVDMEDTNCTGEADVDGDHYCPVGQDLMPYDGDCLDNGEVTGLSDCNDMNASVNPGVAEACGDGQDNDCDGQADFADTACASVTDADGDGVCPNGRDLDGDGSCIDANEEGAAYDCDDTDALISSIAIEICTDLVDQDCDGDPALDDADCVRFLDLDGDRYCPVGQDTVPFDGDCADPGETNELEDCDDTNASVNPAVQEQTFLCFNAHDDNCDGLANGADPACIEYKDEDRDGYCTIGRDMDGDFFCDDAGEQTADVDSAPNDSTVFPGAPENCFDHKDNDQDGTADFLGEGVLPMDTDCRQDVDADGDGACPVGRDINGDGDCTDTGENYRESDCNDGNPDISPRAIEDYIQDLPRAMQPCFDFKDGDCDGDVDLYDVGCFYVYDDDDDGFCRHGIDDTDDGDCLDASEDRGGFDCDDGDADIRPGALEICTDGVDNDCDTFADADDLSCECAVDADCEAMECQTAVCSGSTCVYTAVEDCGSGGGGRCGIAPPARSGNGATALVSLTLLMLALVRARRGRPGASDRTV